MLTNHMAGGIIRRQAGVMDIGIGIGLIPGWIYPALTHCWYKYMAKTHKDSQFEGMVLRCSQEVMAAKV